MHPSHLNIECDLPPAPTHGSFDIVKTQKNGLSACPLCFQQDPYHVSLPQYLTC